jgi:hypothetical protein
LISSKRPFFRHCSTTIGFRNVSFIILNNQQLFNYNTYIPVILLDYQVKKKYIYQLKCNFQLKNIYLWTEIPINFNRCFFYNQFFIFCGTLPSHPLNFIKLHWCRVNPLYKPLIDLIPF